MTTLQALIWDVDGTLAETERDGHRVAFNEAFAQLGIPWRWSEQAYGRLLRVTGGRERLLYDMARRAHAPQDEIARAELATRLHKLKNDIYAGIVAEGRIALRPGVAELMADCRAAKLPMAIATTTSRRNVDALLVASFGSGWEREFACVLCAEDAPVKKPDPQVYRLALQRLGLPADAVLAIEDSPPGVAACVAAGVAVIVTRSVYFQACSVDRALAHGPGLHSRGAWMQVDDRTAEGLGKSLEKRVDLTLLKRWHAGRARAGSTDQRD